MLHTAYHGVFFWFLSIFWLLIAGLCMAVIMLLGGRSMRSAPARVTARAAAMRAVRTRE